MRATVIVPTHDHAATLPLAVGSALGQSVTDLEVVVVGDGVTASVRQVAAQLVRTDPRVVFLDLPKGPHHGERHRDTAVRGARSEAVFYLCDDDLLLPRHVENLLPLLERADLVQSRNGWVDVSGQMRLHPTNLASAAAVAWHLREPARNATSLTGSAHTRSAYLRLDPGWATPPPGEWPDHHLWKQFFRLPGFRGATHPELTALQLPTTAGREDWDQDQRLDELRRWRDRVATPEGRAWLQAELLRATAHQLDVTHLRETDLAFAVDDLEARLASVLSSRSWRLTEPMRRAVSVLRRRAGDPLVNGSSGGEAVGSRRARAEALVVRRGESDAGIGGTTTPSSARRTGDP